MSRMEISRRAYLRRIGKGIDNLREELCPYVPNPECARPKRRKVCLDNYESCGIFHTLNELLKDN